MTNYERHQGVYTYKAIEQGTSVIVLDPQSDRYQWIGKAAETWIPMAQWKSVDVKLAFEDGTTEEYQRRTVRPVTITH